MAPASVAGAIFMHGIDDLCESEKLVSDSEETFFSFQ